MKKAYIILLRTVYISAIIAWLFLACVLRIADSTAGIAALEVIGMIGFGSWLLQNYFEWRWENGG